MIDHLLLLRDHFADRDGLWLLRDHLYCLTVTSWCGFGYLSHGSGLGWRLYICKNLDPFAVWLPFCGPNVIDQFMCNLNHLLKLVYMDTHSRVLFIPADKEFTFLLNFLLLTVSYVVILHSLKSQSLRVGLKYLSNYLLTSLWSFYSLCLAYLSICAPWISSHDKSVAMF